MTVTIFDEAIFDEVVFDGLSRAVLHAFIEVAGGANAITYSSPIGFEHPSLAVTADAGFTATGAVGTGARSFEVSGGACAKTFEVTV